MLLLRSFGKGFDVHVAIQGERDALQLQLLHKVHNAAAAFDSTTTTTRSLTSAPKPPQDDTIQKLKRDLALEKRDKIGGILAHEESGGVAFCRFLGPDFSYSCLIAGGSRRFEDAQTEGGGGGEGYRLYELESMVIRCLWVAIYRKINAHL
jgi:hypothetical protein